MGDIQELAHDQFEYEPVDRLGLVLQAGSRAMTACYRRSGLEALGLTYSEYVVLLVLWEHEQVSMKFLGAAMKSDSGVLSPLVKHLTLRGLTTRWRDPRDERSVLVAATEAGRALREGARGVASEVERATGMSPGEVARLCRQLDRLAARVR